MVTLAHTERSQNCNITVLFVFVSRADILVIVNAVHCIVFGAIGMAAEAKIQFITSGITFMNSRLGKGAAAALASDQLQITHGYQCASVPFTIIANIFALFSFSFTAAGFFYVFVGSLSLEQDWWRLLIGA